jgi:hypothetical protein
VNTEQRIKDGPAERRLPDNLIRMDELRSRRAVPRWIEWTSQNERRGKDLSGYTRGDAA